MQRIALRSTFLCLLATAAGGASSVEAQRFTGCNEDQTRVLTDALRAARVHVVDAMNDLLSVADGGDTTRFNRWFGSPDDGALEVVSQTMSYIYGQIYAGTFLCTTESCGPGEPAWVWQGLSTVRICPYFFEASFEEIAVGAIIHEFSHLVGTEDDVGAISCGNYGRHWPMIYSEQLDTATQVDSAENYRLYAVDWQPEYESSTVCVEGQ